jgi:hypothetical protein
VCGDNDGADTWLRIIRYEIRDRHDQAVTDLRW